MDYPTSLKLLDLNDTEIKAYMSLLQIGSGTIQDIVLATHIKRTTAYSVLQNLIQKGLITVVTKNKKKIYSAENPKKITHLLEKEQENLDTKKQQLKEAIPELASVYNAHINKPKVRFYEGAEAVIDTFNEPLDLPKNSETLVFSNSDELETDFMKDAVIDFMDKRTEKKILNRSIAENTKFLKEIQDNDKKQYRDMTLIDHKKYPALDRINIYGNKVSIISFKNKFALTLESKSVAKTFKSLYELAWIGAEKVGKPSPKPYIPPKK